MKYYEVFWRIHGETYCSFVEEGHLKHFIYELQGRLNVEYIEVVTHETIT